MRPLPTAIAALLLVAGGLGAMAYLTGWPAPVAAMLPGSGEKTEEASAEEPPTPVVLAEAGLADIALTLESVGDTVARESVTVTARVSGRVTEIAFTDGQDVAEGDILVRLDPADAQDQVRVAEAAAEEARQAFGRASQLAQDGTGPRAVANDLQRQAEAADAEVASARERLDDYNIRAPFAGRLGLRNISLGTLIQPGGEVALLDAVDPIEIRFTVPERYLGQIRMGAPIEAASVAFPDEPFRGEVTAIASRVDPALRTVTIEASVPNGDEKLLPGMLMNVTLQTGQREDAVTVPPLAVQIEGANHFVFAEEDGKAERIEVRVGQRDADRVEIVDGLEAGRRVVVEGFQDLTSGQAIEVKDEAEGDTPPARDGPEAGEAQAAAPAARG
ncbi:efflux RND transporter periplasmic adaptor subunit [Aureimonas sp. AU22]|uniref:efflux RND transporter periplasmic adaptor subunit n=1 Tax=Aureimonas sp. AU22 TaxID=1638162 RepID=UPI0007850539|nr:efflux RND transporter periplasmic adaptor subunit [Aureimonas sp. AU22]